MEDLFGVRIIHGLFPAGLVQSLLLNTKCIEGYSPVLQVTLLGEYFTLPSPKNTLPFRYVPLLSPLNSKPTSLSFGLVPLPWPPSQMTFCIVSGRSRAGGNKNKV